MSFDFTTLKNWISETEADVLSVVAQIKAEATVIESDITAALHWVASNAPTIAADIGQVVSVVETVGLGANPEVAAAITAANLAVQGLNAFAIASQSGKNNTQAVLAGYSAVKQAQAAAASAAAIVTTAPTK